MTRRCSELKMKWIFFYSLHFSDSSPFKSLPVQGDKYRENSTSARISLLLIPAVIPPTHFDADGIYYSVWLRWHRKPLSMRHCCHCTFYRESHWREYQWAILTLALTPRESRTQLQLGSLAQRIPSPWQWILPVSIHFNSRVHTRP